MKRYLECFVGFIVDMPMINPKVACHELSIDLIVKLVQQKKRHHGLEWSVAIKVKIKKLLKVGFTKEVLHIIWLVNVVMVKKVNVSWKMCADFIDLNKAYLKDSYLLPNMNSLVDVASSYTILSFCDAFSGYN